ncbi:amidohydrolase family protein [Chloroflexota bacterium]
MNQTYSLKIDIFPHILPGKFKEAVEKVAPANYYGKSALLGKPALWDLERRFRIMDKYPGLVQVLTMAIPPVEAIADPQKATDLAKLANDEMAELVLKYPDRFVAAVACLPMNNVDATLNEVDRVINDLKFRGVQVFSHINDKPLDSPEFLPLYEKMSQYNLPIWIHPRTGITHIDYLSEGESKYLIWGMFGWPYETSAAMARLVFSGILEKYPNLKIIAHHAGAMIPFLDQRIIGLHDTDEMLRGGTKKVGLSKAPIEYFKMFYTDTALYGSTPGLMCAKAFFGADHLLFGTDMPFDFQDGDRFTRQTINSIEQMEISDADKKKIFEDNARELLRLPI